MDKSKIELLIRAGFQPINQSTMSGLTKVGAGGRYITIAEGRLRMQVDENHPDAQRREWEKDGKTGVKFELVFSKIDGVIKDIQFNSSEFGESLNIHIDTDDGEYILSTPSDSRYATDFMRRLPGVNLNKLVELTPYDITDEKRNTGIKVVQDGETIKNQYYDGKKNIKGMPEMDIENPDGDDWKMYFIKVKKFLKQQTLEQVKMLELPIDNDDYPI